MTRKLSDKGQTQTFIVNRRMVLDKVAIAQGRLTTSFRGVNIMLKDLARLHPHTHRGALCPLCLNAENRVCTLNHYRAELEGMLSLINNAMLSASTLDMLDSIRED